MATVHMICGSTGAGKTTHAIRLAAELGAQRHSIDEWMAGMFWMDAPETPDYSWAIERVGRCETLIWALCLRDLAAGRDVVLDLGFSTRMQRDGFKAKAAAAGAQWILWHLDVPVETRRARVARRNAERGETFDLDVDQETFDWMEGHFQPPEPDEHARVLAG
jgi:predicted kinase